MQPKRKAGDRCERRLQSSKNGPQRSLGIVCVDEMVSLLPAYDTSSSTSLQFCVFWTPVQKWMY